MKTQSIFLFAFAILLGCAKSPQQGNPHFVGPVTANFDKDGSSLVVIWKEAGLGEQDVDYQVSANATANYVCVNNSGRCPKAENKTTVSGPIVGMISLSSEKNGQITGSLTLLPPDAGDFACPSGQTLTLAEVSYSEIKVTDLTNSISADAMPSALGSLLFTCP